MAGNKISSKQIVSKDVLKQLYKQSEYFSDDTDNIELDNLLRAIDSAVTPPLRMYESSTPDLVLNIESISVSSPETDIRKTIPPISNLLPTFTSGTVTFPASSGGNATPSVGDSIVITVSSGNFLKVGINLKSDGDLALVAGSQGASEAAASTPQLPPGAFPIGYVVLENVGGVIQNIENSSIVQYVGGGGGGSGSGSGELNLIESPDTADDWGVTGTATVSTTLSTSLIPLFPLKENAVLLQFAGSAGTIYYRFQVPDALKNSKLKLTFYQENSSGWDATDQINVDVFTNTASDYSGSYTELPLSTDSAGETRIVEMKGQFVTSFDTDDSQYYELRFTRVGGNPTVALNNVLVGPGSIKQGAVITPWENDTSIISLTNFGSGAAVNTFRHRRVGNSMEFYGQLTAGSGPAGSPYLSFVDYTMDTTLVADNNMLGNFKALNPGDSSTSNIMGVLFYNGTNANRLYTSTSSTSNELDTNAPLSNTGKIVFRGTVPIAQWAGSGTLNIGENDVEYSFNNGTWNTASETSSFAYGPGGGTIGGLLTTNSLKRVRFQSPIQPTDEISIELSDDGIVWIKANEAVVGGSRVVPSVNSSDTVYSGINLQKVSGSATDVNVYFGKYQYIANDDSPLTDWTTGYWRVVKRKAGTAVGFGLVSGSSSGLMPANINHLDDAAATRMGLKSYSHGTTYNGGNAPTISGPAGLSVTNSHFIPYQMQDGAWRLKMNVTIEFTSTSNADISINGVVFDVDTALACTSASAVQGPVSRSVGTVDDVLIRLFTSTTFATVSGDVGLSSKPTWAY